MKKIKITLLTLLLTIPFLFSGCSWSWDGSDTAKKDEKIGADFTQIAGEENLYYNNRTKIVYWIGGSYMVNVGGDDYTTSYMVAYFAPNGKPYIYDNGLKEIR